MSKQWSVKNPFTKDNYVLRLLSAPFGPSSKGNTMFTAEFEIASPNEMVSQGETYTVTGTKLRHYVTVQVFLKDGSLDIEKTQKLAEGNTGIEAFYKAFGLVKPDDFNAENPDISVLIGKTTWALVEADAVVQRKDPTPEQSAAKQLGDIIVNPVSGEKNERYYPKVVEFYGPATI